MSRDHLDIFNPTEEHKMLRQTVRDFVQAEVEPQALDSDRREHFNRKLFNKVAALGLLGVTVPEKFGGAGLDVTASVIVHEELSASDPGFCLAYLAHSLLCVNNIAVNCDDKHKMQYLPKLCSGEWMGAMAISEPGAGTDVMGMTTFAQKYGKDYTINGRKMWITNGTIDEDGTPCDLLWLYAKTQPSGSSKQAISTFLIDGGTPGFTVGQKLKDKLGMRASNTAELCFDNCVVSRENMVGEEGSSLSHMMRNLEIERVGLAAMGVGIARRSLDVMVRYANERKAFGKNLSAFGQIQHHIGESFAELQAARAYLYNTAMLIKLDRSGQRLDSDGVKLFASQIGKRIADRAIQVLGGYGYVGEYVVERLWRDAKLLEIGGGTLEAHQKNITTDLAKGPLAY